MATDLERQFFDTFGIKTRYVYYIKDTSIKLCYYSATKKYILDYFTNKNCIKYKVFNVKIEHPQITDRILLKLICICSQYGFCPTARNTKDLKLKVLKRLFKLKENLKNNYEHQGYHNVFTRKVRTLFEEE